MFAKFKKDVLDIRRFSQILAVLIKEGFSTLLYELEIHTLLPFFSRISHHLRSFVSGRIVRSYERSLV